MLINIAKFNGESELRSIRPGQHLTGLRLYSIVLESPEDIRAILQDPGREWFMKDVMHRFKRSTSET